MLAVPPSGHFCEFSLTIGPQRLSVSKTKILRCKLLNVESPIGGLPTLSCPTSLRGIRIDSFAKMAKPGPTARQAELFLKLRAAMTHPSYSPLTSHSSHYTSYSSHSDSYKPTYFQICSITMTCKPNLLCAQDAEETHSENQGSSPSEDCFLGLWVVRNNC